MATNAELTEENDRLRAELDALSEQNIDLLADIERLQTAAESGTTPARAPHRVNFVSEGTRQDIEQAQARIENDAKLTHVDVTDTGTGVVFHVTADGVEEKADAESPGDAVTTDDVADLHGQH